MLVYVKHRYIAQDEDELSIQPGDVLDLIEEYDDGWCLLQRDGDSYTGLAPLNHLNIVMDDDDAHMNNLGDQDVSDTDIVDRGTSDALDTGSLILLYIIESACVLWLTKKSRGHHTNFDPHKCT